MHLSKRLSGLCLLAAAVWGSAPAAFGAAKSDRIVVMISLDGLAGYYMDDPKAEMPTLRQLAEEGARAGSMKASTPTVTWPNHTTLVTGDNPARHGVVGNNFYNREKGKREALIGDPIYDKDQIVRVPTIYDLAKKAGMSTASVAWPATKNARTLDWTSGKAKKGEAEKAAAKVGGNEFETGVAKDEERTQSFLQILREHRPNVGLLHLANVDHTEHLNGPRTDAAYAAIKEVDRQVAEVWDELKKDYAGKATLLIVSDHGFSPIEHAILPNVTLREAGLIDVKGVRVVKGSVVLVPQGGAAMVYVTDQEHRTEVIERVRKAFTGAAGIRKVVGPEGFAEVGVADPKDDPHSPDMVLLSEEGWVFGDTAAGALPFVDKPEKRGSHGHDATLPDLHATFVAWGVGIKPGVKLGEISNIDVAPTMAKLLGIEMPGTDGKPLAGILAE